MQHVMKTVHLQAYLVVGPQRGHCLNRKNAIALKDTVALRDSSLAVLACLKDAARWAGIQRIKIQARRKTTCHKQLAITH